MSSHVVSELSVVTCSCISDQACSIGPVEPDFEKGLFLILFLGILWVEIETYSVCYDSVKSRGISLCLSLQLVTV